MSDETNSKNKSSNIGLSAIGRFFLEHPAILVSLLYLWVTTIGVAYSWSLYRQYGINVFDFSETNDFLLAAFKEPTTFVMTVFTIALATPLLYYLVPFLDWLHRLLFRLLKLNTEALIPQAVASVLRIASIVITFVIYTFWLPHLIATEGGPSREETPVRVQYKAASDPGAQSSAQQIVEYNMYLIGSTERFTFFYDYSDGHAISIPHAQLVHIEFLEPN